MSGPGARPPAAAAAAAGCYYLRPGTPEGQDLYLRFDQTARRSPYRMSRILARHQLVTKIQQEIEAKEACDWLRAAGFPQYAQLYEDSQFPINILAVKNDHDFLEKDLVEPLYRAEPGTPLSRQGPSSTWGRASSEDLGLKQNHRLPTAQRPSLTFPACLWQEHRAITGHRAVLEASERPEVLPLKSAVGT